MSAGGEWRGYIERMYWGVSPAVLEGVVDQVRTALINLLAEITAHMPEGVDTPSPEVATNAVKFLVTGEHHKISFSAPRQGPRSPHPNLRSISGAGCELLQPSSASPDRWTVYRTHGNTTLELLTLADRPSRIRYRSSPGDR
jgi:hypothetical protein